MIHVSGINLLLILMYIYRVDEDENSLFFWGCLWLVINGICVSHWNFESGKFNARRTNCCYKHCCFGTRTINLKLYLAVPVPEGHMGICRYPFFPQEINTLYL
eukprot:UN08496